MADKDRHTDAMRHHLNRGIEDFLCFDRHLPFFLGEPVIKKLVDMRDDVKGNILGELFGLERLIDINAASLVEQLIHA